MASTSVRSTRRAGATMAMAFILFAVFIAGAGAQTLAQPNPKTNSSPALSAVKPPPRRNACSTYGAGFVQVPGTNTCVKIGVAVRAEAASQLGH